MLNIRKMRKIQTSAVTEKPAMAACEPSRYLLRLNRVFGSLLCYTRNRYVASSEWCYTLSAREKLSKN